MKAMLYLAAVHLHQVEGPDVFPSVRGPHGNAIPSVVPSRTRFRTTTARRLCQYRMGQDSIRRPIPLCWEQHAHNVLIGSMPSRAKVCAITVQVDVPVSLWEWNTYISDSDGGESEEKQLVQSLRRAYH